MKVFVNRRKEIEWLKREIKAGGRVLILGLRGYGKTSLVKKVVEELKNEGALSIYVDCLRVYDGKDLLLEALNSLEALGYKIPSEIMLKVSESDDARKALNALFEIAEILKCSAIILDEFSALVQRLGGQKPFKGAGGVYAFAQHMKSLLDSHSISVIFLDTSISSLIKLFSDYSSPLFREIDARLYIEPLDIESSIDLVDKLTRIRGLSLSEEEKLRLAEFCSGVPQYIRMACSVIREGLGAEGISKLLEEELISGVFNDYFQAMFEKFSPSEQEVLFLISRGINRFGEIERNVPGAFQAIDLLLKKGVITKFQRSRKDVRYFIRDRLFAVWLSIQEFPKAKKLSLRRAKLFYIGLEAILREVLRTLKEEVILKDFTGEELKIPTFEEVMRYEGVLGEINVIALSSDGRTFVFEVYGGLECGADKVEQLLRNMINVEKLGYKNIVGVLVSYFGFKDEALKKIDELRKMGMKVYLLTYREIREISKKSAIRAY